MKFYEINAGFLKEVSSTSSGDTASRRILNTTHIIDPSYQLRCTAYMLRNKDKPVKCQLLLPTKRELYVSGRGTIHTNCTGNCMAARSENLDRRLQKGCNRISQLKALRYGLRLVSSDQRTISVRLHGNSRGYASRRCITKTSPYKVYPATWSALGALLKRLFG
ncbi:hypothetical protein DPMN_003580 [Dreissena polymorpha]|uniref:Uncharacterized protein n=1 Tax=Dreissena polymorpha TaxID=45954 RepID=A0A9D4RSR7_DREPO|nr:hypothetical protein DPMN_003580 [Dreissena polymorpha]